jgi:ion channel-forming bestrophin family protein
MMVSNRGSVLGLLTWQWRNSLLFVGAGALTPFLHEVLGWNWMRLPMPPVVILGSTIGIFVSFRTNSAYARWWEGRQLWGRMVNASRHFTSQVLTYLPRAADGSPTELQRRLVMRHVAYVHALRVLMRLQDPAKDPELARTLDDRALLGSSNLTFALVHAQQREVVAAADRGELDPHRLQSLDATFAELLGVQGGCERIKKTPMPRGYAFIAERLVAFFSLLLPLALTTELSWWMIPLNLLICLAFQLISEAGRVLEDPFTMFWNGLPLSQLSTMIEVNVREQLGDTELPKIPTPNEDGILM